MAEVPLRYIGNSGRAAASSPADFETLFDRHWARVFRLLLRIVGDPDQADELALDTFWALHDHLEGLDEDQISRWLYRVATNNGLNALRARQRRTRYEGEAGRAFLEGATRNPIAEAERADDREAVREILLQMKPRDAQLLFLRHAGFSYGELAAVIEVAPGSVGTLLARAEREFERRYRATRLVEGEER